MEVTKVPRRVSVGQRREPIRTSSVLGKGTIDRCTVSNFPKEDRGGQGDQMGHKLAQEGLTGYHKGARWAQGWTRRV